jgi:hypothetical protein
MNTTPPKTNSAPSQMTSILASTSLYSPNPLAPAPYHQFSKAGQSRQQPSRGSPEASCECGRNCSACSGAQRIRRDFRASLRTDAYRDQTPKEVARPQQCRRRRPFRLHSTPPSKIQPRPTARLDQALVVEDVQRAIIIVGHLGHPRGSTRTR